MGLRDQILKTTSGRLAETAVVPTSTLAGQQGIASPLTPLGGALIGANDDQQKMMGTPAQKQNALRQSLDKVNTLGEAQADRQAKTEMSAEQAGAAQRGQKLQDVLRGNKDRVANMVNTEIGKLQTAQLSKSRSGIMAAAPSNQAQVDQLYEQLQALPPERRVGEDGMAIVNQISTLSGKDYGGLAQTVLEEAEEQKAEAAELAAQATADTVDLDMLLPQLGMNKQEMAGLLNVPETILDKLSLSELSNLLDLAVGTETTRTDAAGSSILGGAAERAAAAQRSADLSTSGVASMEAGMQRLSDEIAQSGNIQFAGKQWTVDELLSDENVSKLVSDYLLNPNSAESKALASDPNAKPLIDFVNRNSAALQEAAKQFSTVATEAQAVQDTNKAIAKIGNTVLPDALMRKIYPSWGSAANARYSPTGLVSALHGLPPEQQEAAANSITAAFEKFPNFPLDVTSINSGTLGKLVAKKNGASPLDTLISTMDITQRVENTGSVDDIIGMIFGDSVQSQSQAQTLLDEDRQRQKMRGTVPEYSYLDSDNNGRVDDLGTLKQSMLKRIDSANSIDEVIAGNKPQNPAKAARSINPNEKAVYDIVAKSGARSVRDLEKKSTNIEELQAIQAAGLGSVGLGTKVTDLTELNKLMEEEKLAEGTAPIGRIFTSGADISSLDLSDPQTAERRKRINKLRKQYGMEVLPEPNGVNVSSAAGSSTTGGSKKSSGGEAADKFKRSALNPIKVLTGKNKLNPF